MTFGMAKSVQLFPATLWRSLSWQFQSVRKTHDVNQCWHFKWDNRGCIETLWRMGKKMKLYNLRLAPRLCAIFLSSQAKADDKLDGALETIIASDGMR